MKGICAILTTVATLSVGVRVTTAADSAGTGHAPASSESCFLFSYFIGNGEDGLHLAHSTDGYKWEVRSREERASGAEGRQVQADARSLPAAARRHFSVGLDRQRKRPDHRARFLPGPAALVGTAGHWRYGARAPAINCWAPEVVYDQRSNST